MAVNWVKCQGAVWCRFLDVDPKSIGNVSGVYIIWQAGGEVSRAVYVGQGNIAERLSDHRRDGRIIAYQSLLVTWAALPQNLLDGAERYLARVYRPLVGERVPNAPEVIVNHPT